MFTSEAGSGPSLTLHVPEASCRLDTQQSDQVTAVSRRLNERTALHCIADEPLGTAAHRPVALRSRCCCSKATTAASGSLPRQDRHTMKFPNFDAMRRISVQDAVRRSTSRAADSGQSKMRFPGPPMTCNAAWIIRRPPTLAGDDALLPLIDKQLPCASATAAGLQCVETLRSLRGRPTADPCCTATDSSSAICSTGSEP